MSPTFGCGLSVCLVTARSAYFGVSVAVPVLLPGLESGSAEFVTVATFVWAAGIVFTAGARTVAVIVSVSAFVGPVRTVPTSHTPVVWLYVPWLGVAERNVSPAVGNCSVTSTRWAVLGPLFVSVTVNVIVSPTFGVGLLTVFTTARSAVLTVNVAEPVVT